MTYSITTRLLTFLLALTFACGIAFAMPMSTNAHDGEVHLSEDATDLEKMAALIELLQQLVALLEEQLEHKNEGAHMAAAALQINVEEHGGVTHVHVHENGVQTDAFFLEDLALGEEAAIIAAIAARTGHSESEVEAAATFPTHEEEDEHAHEDEEADHGDDHTTDTDLEGIHIMADGTVMLGNGEEVHDATITEDGMIMLADGTIVEPAFDLR